MAKSLSLHSSLPYEETSLIRALSRGDRAAYSTLYSHWLDNLLDYVSLFTASKEEAEEIVQDLFLRIWEKRASLGEVESFQAYLFRAAKNQVINTIRRQQVHHRALSYFRERSVEDSNSEDTARRVDYRQTHALLRAAIALLPARRKTVFLLSTEEHLSLDEIAVRMGISKNVVKKQLYDAYATIRAYLAEHGELSAGLLLFMTLLQA